MKTLKLIPLLLTLILCLALPGLSGAQTTKLPKHTIVVPTRKSSLTLKYLGHGVYIDNHGQYHDRSGKFIKNSVALAALHPATKIAPKPKAKPLRDAKGRFIKNPFKKSTPQKSNKH